MSDDNFAYLDKETKRMIRRMAGAQDYQEAAE